MKRLIYLRAQHERALEAMSKGEWWNGRIWRPHAALPRTLKEAEFHRTAHERLGELIDAMIGGDDGERLRKAKNFGQSANARRKKDSRKEDSQDAWATLVAYARSIKVDLLTAHLTKQLIDDCAKELDRGRYRTRKGGKWTREGLKSLIRRRRVRL